MAYNKKLFLCGIGLFLFVLSPYSFAQSQFNFEPPHVTDPWDTEECLQCHYMENDGSGLLPLPRNSEQEALCKTCHNATGVANAKSNVGNHVVVHSGDNMTIDCSTCHNPHAYDNSTDTHAGGGNFRNLSLLRSSISTDRVPNVLNPIVSRQGGNRYGFDEGDQPYNGVCQACHTETAFHTNDDSTDHSHMRAMACTTCHTHEAGFKVDGSGGNCDACHGFYPDGNSFPNTAGSHATHYDAAYGPGLEADDCWDCHTELSSGKHYNGVVNFASGTDGNSDGNIELSETDVCDTCHSPFGAYDGVDDAEIGAKNNWDDGVYNGSDLVAGKEKWCAGCHDDFAANSAADGSGVDAPNVIGEEDAATDYGTGYGYYKTGHGLASGFFPASGAPAAGIQCLDCHDFTTAHIDAVARTYSSASDNYQFGYRLRDVNGAAPLEVPRTDGVTDTSDFALCFECHDDSPFLVESDNNTNFRNPNAAATNQHWYHLQSGVANGGAWINRWDSDWDGTNGDSKLSCTACHNVHGSPSPRMIRHGELISTPGTADKVPALDFEYNPTGSYPLLADSTGGTMGTGVVGGGGPGTPASNGVCSMCHANKAIYNRTPLVTGTKPDTPSNSSPANGETGVTTTPTLEASAFSDSDVGDTHALSQWQITSAQGSYISPAYDSGAVPDLTSHTVASALNNSLTYYWHVRYQDSNGLWSDYSSETSFTTDAGSGGGTQTLTLHPSGLASFTGSWTTSGGDWPDVLDSNDGDTSYATMCCSSPGWSFYADMDDPAGLSGATIESITVYVYARNRNSPSPGGTPMAANVDIGYKTGTSTVWRGNFTTDTSGDYNLIASTTYTTDSDGGSLDVTDIQGLQVAVKRNVAGSPQLRVTEVYADVEYIP